MEHKKILIINGHPDPESFNVGLAESYKKGAINSGAEVELINIRNLDFNPNLEFGYREKTELEPDLIKAIDQIKNANHLVWIYPTWWYGYPAMMKGFIDRTFLPGLMFKFTKGKPVPDKLLKGRSGRIIITGDTPSWYNNLVMKKPAINSFKKGTLEFSGVSPVKVTYISPLKSSTAEFRQKWLDKIEQLGRENK